MHRNRFTDTFMIFTSHWTFTCINLYCTVITGNAEGCVAFSIYPVNYDLALAFLSTLQRLCMHYLGPRFKFYWSLILIQVLGTKLPLSLPATVRQSLLSIPLISSAQTLRDFRLYIHTFDIFLQISLIVSLFWVSAFRLSPD